MSELDLAPMRSALANLEPQGRSALLPALQAAQSLYGYLPEEITAEIGRFLHVPLADIYGVIDFYAMLYHEPVGKNIIRVCGDPACDLAGSQSVLQAVCRHLDISPGATSANGSFTVERSPCLGLCENAPAVLVNERALGPVDPAKPAEISKGLGTTPQIRLGGDIHLLTANCGNGHPTGMKEYISSGGYQALKKALGMSPKTIIEEIKASGLVGRGGAAFPTGIKWESATRAQDEPKYVVCNADESEPGTFKDRILMHGDPHRILEGMLIAGYAIGSKQGYLYIRGEYPEAANIMRKAIQEALQAGYLGKNILNHSFDFNIEIRLGAGAYICGEETALFESIEGKRGFPRVKPPFPTTFGLFGKPTAINNVETLANIPLIISLGAQGYRKYGTDKSPGTKLFCLSGDVVRPGLYEVPFGVTLHHLLNDLAGGVSGGEIQAILVGGAAGSFATKQDLEVKLTFEDLSAQGLPLGSGVIMVINDQRDIRRFLKGLAHFFADESCGKCYPCQLGTQRQYEILGRLAEGNLLEGDAELLNDVGWTMIDASLCGLGQTAATAVLSAMELWPQLFTSNGKSLMNNHKRNLHNQVSNG